MQTCRIYVYTHVSRTCMSLYTHIFIYTCHINVIRDRGTVHYCACVVLFKGTCVSFSSSYTLYTSPRNTNGKCSYIFPSLCTSLIYGHAHSTLSHTHQFLLTYHCTPCQWFLTNPLHLLCHKSLAILQNKLSLFCRVVYDSDQLVPVSTSSFLFDHHYYCLKRNVLFWVKRHKCCVQYHTSQVRYPV